MNLLEFENERFGNLWNAETIAELEESEPKKSINTDIFYQDEMEKELYRLYQEANWQEYFDPARTYRYCLWR